MVAASTMLSSVRARVNARLAFDPPSKAFIRYCIERTRAVDLDVRETRDAEISRESTALLAPRCRMCTYCYGARVDANGCIMSYRVFMNQAIIV